MSNKVALRMSEKVYENPDVKHKSEKVLFEERGDVLWIAFAGTDDWKDILEDLHIKKKKIDLRNSHIKVHSGFWDSWLQVRDIVLSRIRRVKPKYVRLCGHSKGGAMALCAFADLPYQIHSKEGIDTCLFVPIVFGCPRVFASSSLKQLNRFLPRPLLNINQGDPVVSVPRKYMGFAHWGRDIRVRTPWWKRIYVIRSFLGLHDLDTYKRNFQ